MLSLRNSKQVIAAVLGLACTAVTLAPTAYAAPAKKLHMPAQLTKKAVRGTCQYQEDTLLVMPNASADKEEVADALKDVHGTVVGSIGSGKMLCLIVKCEKGTLAKTEAKLAKDKHFTGMQRNFMAGSEFVPNDPGFIG